MTFYFTGDELQEGSAADKNYIALKIDRSAKHIQWLKKNQKLLTILLNYCSLHGASGGDLAGKGFFFSCLSLHCGSDSVIREVKLCSSIPN